MPLTRNYQHELEEMDKFVRWLSPPRRASYDGEQFWLTDNFGKRECLGDCPRVALEICKQIHKAQEELYDKYHSWSDYDPYDDYRYDYDPYYDDDVWHNTRDDPQQAYYSEEAAWRCWWHDTITDPELCRCVVRPEWLSEDVMAVVGVMERESGWADAPVLADALEDAGCDDAHLLGALRTHDNDVTETHLWVVELIRLAARE